MRKLLLMASLALAAQASCNCKALAIESSPGDALGRDVINGIEVSPESYPEVVMLKPIGCTGVMVSDKVFITAGHCASKTKTVVMLGTKSYQVSSIRKMSGADLAVGLLTEKALPMDQAASVHTDRLSLGDVGLITGFGCTAPNGKGYGTLRQGTAKVSSMTATEYTMTGGAQNCYGDSGGPVFLDTAPHAVSSIISKRSTGSLLFSYQVRLDTKPVKAFLDKFASDFGVDICGVTLDECLPSSANETEPLKLKVLNPTEGGAVELELKAPLQKPLVVEHFALFCGACNDNAKNVNQLVDANKDLFVVAATLDRTPGDQQGWITKHRPNHLVVDDSQKALWKTLPQHKYIPTVTVFNCDLTVAYQHVGVWSSQVKIKLATYTTCEVKDKK